MALADSADTNVLSQMDSDAEHRYCI